MMKYYQVIRSWLMAYIKAQQQKIDKKTLYMAISVLLFILFADTILLFIGHLLHVMFEFIESLFEHFVESAFHLTHQQAGVLFFYLVLALSLVLLHYVSRKCYCWGIKKCANARENWCAKAKAEKFATVIRTVLIISVICKIVFIRFA
jgi:hypothetical protein